ncbi:MAG: ROK family protein [Maioricimonas sp. JB045]
MSESTEQSRWLGFDLGGTKMLAQVYDGENKALGRARKKTKGTSDAKAGLERIGETIELACEDAKVDPKELSGIGIGCPGPVDMENGTLLDPPNLAWNRVPVRKYLEDRFECPVAVLNDVDAGVYGEYRFGAAREATCVIGVFPGTGIGGGCIYRGEVLSGRTASCMEIGHIQVMPNGPICGCGHRGCLEAVASRLAIAASAAKAAYRGQAPGLAKSAGTDLGSIRSGALADSIEADDEIVKQIIKEAARQIGIAVAGLIHVLSPDVIVLGGGLVEAMPDLFTEHVSKAARKRVMPVYEDSFKVVPAALGDDAAVLGGAAWVRHVLEQKNS